eukprot:1152710-Pelagomonas_calceolata.AAC.3
MNKSAWAQGSSTTTTSSSSGSWRGLGNGWRAIELCRCSAALRCRFCSSCILQPMSSCVQFLHLAANNQLHGVPATRSL